MNETFDRHFYEREPQEVARALLASILVHGEARGRIVETEAYLASNDSAAHAYKGRTPRTKVLFGPPGHAYVYRTRHHHCLNVAVQPVGVPGCVLIRAVQPIAGIDRMRRRRTKASPQRCTPVPDARLADGPAKVCQAFAIDMGHYGADLCSAPSADTSRLTIIRGDIQVADMDIRVGPRVGISVAKDYPLRFRLLRR